MIHDDVFTDLGDLYGRRRLPRRKPRGTSTFVSIALWQGSAAQFTFAAEGEVAMSSNAHASSRKGSCRARIFEVAILLSRAYIQICTCGFG